MNPYMPTVADYMTPGAQAIASHETLARARETMREHGIRHLPVVGASNDLIGILSERDIAFVQGLGRTRLDAVMVESAMTRHPYAVRPDASLNQVARIMAERKYGAVVVMEREIIIGVLTTTDALHALADTLEGTHTRRSYEGVPTRPAGAWGRRGRFFARERR